VRCRTQSVWHGRPETLGGTAFFCHADRCRTRIRSDRTLNCFGSHSYPISRVARDITTRARHHHKGIAMQLTSHRSLQECCSVSRHSGSPNWHSHMSAHSQTPPASTATRQADHRHLPLAVYSRRHVTLTEAEHSPRSDHEHRGDLFDETIQGTFTVNADCTGSATVHVFHGSTLARTSRSISYGTSTRTNSAPSS